MAAAVYESESSSSSSSAEEFDFDEQIRFEKLEKEQKLAKISGDNAQTYTDTDGTVFEWDVERKAWFPKVDEDFMAQYQMSYGVAYDYEKMPAPSTKQMPSKQQLEEAGEKQQQQPSNEKKRKRKKDKNLTGAVTSSANTWFDVAEEKNTSVYVSNLPSDFTEDEFLELMQKCGLVLYDPFTKKPKIKLYRNDDGTLKGDGRCCYIKVESVGLALQILDGWPLRDNRTLHVERAKFEKKGPEYDASKRKRKLTNKEKKAIKERQEKLFDWRPEKLEIQRGRNERVAVLKYMFSPNELDTDPDFFNDLNDDIKEEAAKAGPVKRIAVCDRNADGIVMVHFKTAEDADKCISAMNGRFYNGKKVEAFTWDGKTKYHVEETEEERAKRLEKWYHFLEQNPTTAVELDVDASNAETNNSLAVATPPTSDRSSPSGASVDTTASTAGTGSDVPLSTPLEDEANNGFNRRRPPVSFRNASGDLSDNSDAAFDSTDDEDSNGNNEDSQ